MPDFNQKKDKKRKKISEKIIRQFPPQTANIPLVIPKRRKENPIYALKEAFEKFKDKEILKNKNRYGFMDSVFSSNHSYKMHRMVKDFFNSLAEINDEGYFDFLSFFVNNSDVLEKDYFAENIQSLEKCFYYSDKWIRDYREWSKNTHNPRKQLSSILRHLFVKYKMPDFMDKAFTERNGHNFIDWYIWIGQGQNLRKAKRLPCPITKMVAHHFMQAPSYCSIPEAIRYAKVIDIGGSEYLAKKIFATRIGTNFENEDFWMSVIKFFINNPMLDPEQYGPIIDYIHNQKFVVIQHPDGTCSPRQPNFSMHHRDAYARVNAMERWHRELNNLKKAKAALQIKWNPTNWKPYFKEYKDSSVWSIKEIITQNELIQEGRDLSHCVATYASSCATGAVSIWSMQLNNKRMATIKVDNRSRKINEARGKYNRPLNSTERNHLNAWASTNNLGFARI